MTNPPTGTVTFLFTDIEGSTKLAQAHPAEWEAARQRHHAILRAACDAQRGHVFQIIGDAFCVAFPTANNGLQAATAAQRALQAEAWGETLIRVRMGLHTGAAEFARRRLPGLPDARPCAAGDVHGLWRTDAPVQCHGRLAIRSGSGGITLRDMGEHRLKGLLNPEHLWQVVAPDLPQDFPPLQSLNAIPNNLPVQLTSFIGREKELADLKRLLPTTRLLTLTGSGGVGKTRLSLQLAADVLDTFKDGVWFIELAPLADPALIPGLIASAIGLKERPGQSLGALLADYFHTRTALLILDNCEHLIAECATIGDTLLRTAPGLAIWPAAAKRWASRANWRGAWVHCKSRVPHKQRTCPWQNCHATKRYGCSSTAQGLFSGRLP